MSRDSLITLPNVLSLSRIGLAVAFALIPSSLGRVALLVVAAATDFLDGFLARRANATSRWGALLDPITDRIFVFTAVCIFLLERQISVAQYFVIIFRDIMTAVGFLVAKSVSSLRPVTFRARVAGKVVTALQLATLVAILVRPDLLPACLVALGALSLVAVVDYTLLLWRERERTPA